MTVLQVIDLAKSSELKQLSIKDDNSVILGYINLGLIELYKRFPLKVEETVIALQDSQDIYSLPTDCMWLVAAYGEVPESSPDRVNVLPINEEDEPDSINTISWNKVQIPLSVTGGYVSLIYVASPTYILDVDSELDLPVQLVEALLHYVGYRAHSSQTGDSNAENNVHYQRFESSCERIIRLGMFTNDDLSMKRRVENGGFV